LELGIPFDVVGRLGDEKSLKFQVDFDVCIWIDGNGRVDSVVARDFNGDEQQVEFDETESINNTHHKVSTPVIVS